MNKSKVLMHKLLNTREEIYNYFHHSDNCQKYFFMEENNDKYATYYTAMYQLQDTGEAILIHHGKGFSKDSSIAYIEFWGIMQAIIIQQDCIKELYAVFMGQKLESKNDVAWNALRYIRNLCAGHPINKEFKEFDKKSKTLERSFMGRNFGGYSCIECETYNPAEHTLNYNSDSRNLVKTYRSEIMPQVLLNQLNLEDLIIKYEEEAEIYLKDILKKMKSTWS